MSQKINYFLHDRLARSYFFSEKVILDRHIDKKLKIIITVDFNSESLYISQ